jgi:hypothetical protein
MKIGGIKAHEDNVFGNNIFEDFADLVLKHLHPHHFSIHFKNHVEMFVLSAKKIPWLDCFTMGTEIDLIHLFYNTVKTGVFLIFEQIIEFKLFFGQEDPRAFVTDAFEDKHRQLVKQWI